MSRTLIACIVLVAACKKAEHASPDPEVARRDAAVAAKAPPADAAPSGAMVAAKDVVARVCACKDVACGEAVLDEAGQKMPALMETATDDEKQAILAARDQAIACMDKLVDASPAVTAAIAEAGAFASEACACADAACADAVVGKHREPLTQARRANMSNQAIDGFMSATERGTSCLEEIGYVGTASPALEAAARATADGVCACADRACANAALRAGARGMAAMVSPADRKAVTDATARAEQCLQKLGGDATSPANGVDMQMLADAMVAAACACKDDACVDKAIGDMAAGIAGHDLTQADLEIMTAASKRADACRAQR